MFGVDLMIIWIFLFFPVVFFGGWGSVRVNGKRYWWRMYKMKKKFSIHIWTSGSSKHLDDVEMFYFSVCLSSSSLFAMMTLVCTKEKKTFQTKFFFRISSTKIFLIIIFLLQQVSCYIQHQQLLRKKVKKLHFHTENTRNRSDERFNNPKNKMTIVIHSFNDDD